MAKDMLFTTLDPTMRAVSLPSGRKVILSDTVGFVSALPTGLIAAFRATLEEVVDADVLVHVSDASQPDQEAQIEDVETVLSELGIDLEDGPAVLMVHNKIDRLPEAASVSHTAGDTIGISAITGEGCERLLTLIDRALAKDTVDVFLAVDPADGSLQAWLHENGEVIASKPLEDGDMGIHCRLGEKAHGQLASHMTKARFMPPWV